MIKKRTARAARTRRVEEEQAEYLPGLQTEAFTEPSGRSREVAAIFLDAGQARQRPAIIPRRAGKRIAFGWYGGKYSHLDWLLPLLPDCHHYCDPPYLHETRGDAKAYGFEMSEKEHRLLARELNACKGRVALSGYRHPLMDELFKGWRRFDAPAKVCHSVKQMRQECVWMNY